MNFDPMTHRTESTLKPDRTLTLTRISWAQSALSVRPMLENHELQPKTLLKQYPRHQLIYDICPVLKHRTPDTLLMKQQNGTESTLIATGTDNTN